MYWLEEKVMLWIVKLKVLVIVISCFVSWFWKTTMSVDDGSMIKRALARFIEIINNIGSNNIFLGLYSLHIFILISCFIFYFFRWAIQIFCDLT